MRQGECLGLTWDRVDLDAGTLTVDRQLVEMTAAEDVAGVHKEDGGYYLVHEARHSTATLLRAAGVPATVVIAIMGHTAITTSMGATSTPTWNKPAKLSKPSHPASA